jgi:hypothetical protein
VGVVKPLAGTEFAPGDPGKRLVHGFSRSAHALFLCVILVWAANVCMSPRASQRRWPRGAPTTNYKTNYYDFDPTTSPKKSGKTPVKSKKTAVFAAGYGRIREGIYVVGADSRCAEIVWRL